MFGEIGSLQATLVEGKAYCIGFNNETAEKTGALKNLKRRGWMGPGVEVVVPHALRMREQGKFEKTQGFLLPYEFADDVKDFGRIYAFVAGRADLKECKKETYNSGYRGGQFNGTEIVSLEGKVALRQNTSGGSFSGLHRVMESSNPGVAYHPYGSGRRPLIALTNFSINFTQPHKYYYYSYNRGDDVFEYGTGNITLLLRNQQQVRLVSKMYAKMGEDFLSGLMGDNEYVIKEPNLARRLESLTEKAYGKQEG